MSDHDSDHARSRPTRGGRSTRPGRGPLTSTSRGKDRPFPSPGARTESREIAFPFTPGPIPEPFLEAAAAACLYCAEFDLALPEGAEARLARFAQRLSEANTVMNLTRVDQPRDIASRHLVDCLVFAACLGTRRDARILDLGTGGGLPSIPLAIARPHWRITALDATQKKIAFVAAVAQELGLANLTPVAERAEVLGHQSGHRESYDAVVSRAVAPLPVLLEYSIPFLVKGGYLFASKGSRVADEVDAADQAFGELGCELVSRETYGTLDPDVEFSMLVIRKLEPTRRKYPRHPSKIKNSPLGRLEI